MCYPSRAAAATDPVTVTCHSQWRRGGACAALDSLCHHALAALLTRQSPFQSPRSTALFPPSGACAAPGVLPQGTQMAVTEFLWWRLENRKNHIHNRIF